jgi:hypothetical protein
MTRDDRRRLINPLTSMIFPIFQDGAAERRRERETRAKENNLPLAAILACVHYYNIYHYYNISRIIKRESVPIVCIACASKVDFRSVCCWKNRTGAFARQCEKQKSTTTKW